MTESELKKHLDAAEKSPKQVAAAVSGDPGVAALRPVPNRLDDVELVRVNVEL